MADLPEWSFWIIGIGSFLVLLFISFILRYFCKRKDGKVKKWNFYYILLENLTIFFQKDKSADVLLEAGKLPKEEKEEKKEILKNDAEKISKIEIPSEDKTENLPKSSSLDTTREETKVEKGTEKLQDPNITISPPVVSVPKASPVLQEKPRVNLGLSNYSIYTIPTRTTIPDLSSTGLHSISVRHECELPYKSRNRHIYSGPGPLTASMAGAISRKRNYAELKINTVFEDADAWFLCDVTNNDGSPDARIVSSDRVTAFQCRKKGQGYQCSYAGRMYAIFLQNGHLRAYESNSTVMY